MMTDRGVKMKLTRKYFTLIEFLIAGMVALAILTGSIILYIQLLEVNRDCSAEVILSRASRLMKQKVVRKFKLGEAIWDDIKTVSQQNIKYEFVDTDVSFPDLLTTKKSNIILHFNPGKKELVAQGMKGAKNEKLNNNFDVFIDEFDVVKQDPTGSEILALRRVEVKFVLRLVHAGKTYYRRDSLLVPIMNYQR